MKEYFLGLFFSLLFVLSISAQNREAYIAKFSVIAVNEMHRSGIPASIKLAQAILESNAGASMLAVQANNHFGIKCGNTWKGKKMYRKDDDRNGQGRLIKSCFREFRSAEESFVAHSDFLMDAKKAYRYGPLFKLDAKDYKGWAHGLKKAGYATNSRYPQLLIRIIEDYNLTRFDQASQVAEENEVKKNRRETSPASPTAPKMPESAGTAHTYSKQSIDFNNGVKFVRANEGESVKRLAEKFELSPKRILRYNEELKSDRTRLQDGQKVYLQPKRGSYRGRQKYHIVKPGERLADISDKYGVKVKSLRKRNEIPQNKQPRVNEKIMLKGRTRSRVKVQRESSPESRSTAAESEFIWDENIVVEVAQNPQKEQVRYTVLKSDTLYGISRAHGISVDNLKKVNNLDTDNIHPGQVLIIQ